MNGFDEEEIYEVMKRMIDILTEKGLLKNIPYDDLKDYIKIMTYCEKMSILSHQWKQAANIES